LRTPDHVSDRQTKVGKKVVGDGNAMLIRKANKRRPLRQGNAALAPHAQVSRGEVERLSNMGCANGVYKRAMGMSMDHDPQSNTMLEDGKPLSLIESNAASASQGPMLELARRIRSRMEEIGMKHVDLCRLADVSSGRLGNWTSLSEANNRTPDVRNLIKLAKALRTSTDWLLGLSEAPTIDVAVAMQRLLELDGMSPAKAEVIAQAASRAVELLAAVPGDGDAHTRAVLAAQMAWQTRSQSRPS
jgi:transcriptional regulator with XRE-family HTH domain